MPRDRGQLLHGIPVGKKILFMKIFVTVQPRSKHDAVSRIDATHFRVQTKSPPSEGKANAAVALLLAEYLGVSKSRIKLLAGAKSK